ncbi:efflux RND transporter periplasmic adaptor subunit [Crocinitomix catalasitica]|uniref:efflux RND transporter periplasmic adaptor subunit n=1 Tax=Crocinitomix catalasitica TaxID=184607 RepID=UPI0006847C6B|nr:efflux RND transporter periplasmic adaptor subunit [Crocinitomix catalasitica]
MNSRYKRIKNIIIWSIVIILLGLFIYKQFIQKEPVFITIQKEVVLEETLFAEVSATGTINPIELVEVGTQVSGIISEVMVDFNDLVKEGQTLARMDKRILNSSLLESKSNLIKAEVTLKQAKRDLDRSTGLFKDGYIAEIELEKAQYDFDNAEATYAIAKLQRDKNAVNLGYTNIVSPIDGIVISKNIDVGQTIAASFTTPVLFSIANDLKHMKIEASVDEADIGMVKAGQKVIFTVDAFPTDVFEGVVEQIQLEPTVVQNVVTYNVIVFIQNPELKLMPGMTAILIIRTEEKPNSIAVPNSALSFYPNEVEMKDLARKKYKVVGLNQPEKSTIWVINNQSIIEREVKVNFTNGIQSAISGEINPGDTVVTNINITIGEKKTGSFFSGRNEEEE